MRWYHWVGLGALAVIVVLVWIATGGRGPNPAEKIKREVDAINAKAEVKRVQSELDTERALALVDQKYEAEIAALDEKKRKQAEELRKDPAKLAAFIVRGQG